MKILAFSDIHDEITYLDIINKKTKKYDPDILICAGDISFFARNLNSSMTVLKKLNKPTLIIPGNHETAADIFSFKSENLIPLHKQIYIKDDYCFYGYGGGGFSQTANDLFNNFKKFENKFENKKLIKRAEDLGYNFSIPPIIMRLQHFQMLVNMVSLDKILTETDAPYLSHLVGERNEPVNVIITVKKISEIKKLTEEETKKIIYNNYKKNFEIKTFLNKM